MAKLNDVKTLNMVNGEITKVEYNGDEYVKVDGKAQIGDVVLIAYDSWMDSTKGKFYKYIELSGDDPRIVNDVGDKDSNYHGSYSLFRKIIADQYARVIGRKPKVGDFIKLSRTCGDAYDDSVTFGKYYEIIEIDKCDDPQIIDDDGDTYNTTGDKFEVYEKVTEELITYNGKQYRNLGAVEAKKGDLVKFHDSYDDTESGKLYEVINDHDQYTDDVGIHLYTEGWGGKEERDVYRLVSDDSPKFSVGDTVKLSIPDGERPKHGWGSVKNGEIGKIIRVNGGIKVDFPSHHGWNAEFNELEKVEEGPLKVGDYVVPLPESDDKYKVTNTDMLLGKVVENDDFGEFCVQVIAHKSMLDNVGENYGVDPNYFRKATDEEVAEVKRKLSTPKLSIGDYAKVVEHDNDNYFAGGRTPVGDIVKIAQVFDKTYRVEELDGGSYHGNPHVKKEGLVRATDEEISEVKRQQSENEESEKWTKIGRKPGEFKEGDIVRVLDACGGSLKKGELYEISGIDSGGTEYVTIGEHDWYSENELVNPVESRFDR